MVRNPSRFNRLFLFVIAIAVLPQVSIAAQPSSNTVKAIPEGYNQGTDKISIFQQANDFYRDGNFEKALEGFLFLHEAGVMNGLLFYNVANTYFHLGQLGQAIVWYERATRYLPRNEDLKNNYAFAKQQLADDEFRIPAHTGTIGFFISLHNMLNLRESLYLFLALFWIFTLTLIVRILIKEEVKKGWLQIPCWVLGIAVIISFLSVSQKIYHHEFIHEAIVIESAVEVRTGPDEDLSVLFSIHEGTKVILTQSQGVWQRIILPKNKTFTGWLPKSSVQEI
jgi:tetratricopeptide (TPR) repeat protein